MPPEAGNRAGGRPGGPRSVPGDGHRSSPAGGVASLDWPLGKLASHMRKFLIRRAAFAVLTLWGITVVVFVLSRLGPDPLLMFIRDDSYGVTQEEVAALRARWGLDRPVVVQYFVWFGRTLSGNLGESIASRRPVTRVVGEKVGATFQLGAVAWILATGIGIPLGVLSAVKRGSAWDYFARLIALIGQGTPAFWLALVMILIFAVQLDWLPSASRAPGEGIVTQARHFVLPAIVLALDPWAIYLRLTRSSMLEVLDSEFIKLGRAKGVGRQTIIWKHALRNALIQPLTTSALVFAAFITGAVFVETIFAWPGIGRLSVDATFDNDFPVIAGVVLLFGVIYVSLNIMADLAYALVDPRIRYT